MELADAGGVFHIAIAAGQVQLVRAEAGASGGRIRLDGITLIQQAFFIKF